MNIQSDSIMKRKYLSVLLLLLLPACNFLQDGKNDTRLVKLDESFELRLGSTAILDNDSQITFQELKQDSRCSLDVVCFWEGEIEAVFRFETNHSSDEIDFKGHLDINGEIPLEQVFDGYRIFLERMDPYPGEGKPSDGIVATLRVEREEITN